MMLLIFAVLTAAFVALQGGRVPLAVGCLLVSLALATGLFLFEIHDPVDGFRLPWLQVRSGTAGTAGPG